jgi:hypothetical protein
LGIQTTLGGGAHGFGKYLAGALGHSGHTGQSATGSATAWYGSVRTGATAQAVQRTMKGRAHLGPE